MHADHMYLPSYSVGPDCYGEIPWATRRFGKKAVVIGGKTALSKAKPALLAGIAGSDVAITDFLWYGGDATCENVQALLQQPAVQAADMVFAVGGGRAIDTCKVVAAKLDKPLFTFPTIASNCAPCTAIAVLYNADASFREYFYLQAPAEHAFLNTRIIAEAPASWLWAGIGDALSKGPEVEFAARTAKQLSHALALGIQCSAACPEPLLRHGVQAMRDNRAKRDSYELEQVALDIIVSTGIVSNLTCSDAGYYNSSLAHAVYYGSTVIPRAERHLHGEIVSFGVLCLLTLDGQLEARNRYAAFNRQLGLPVCLSDLNLKLEDLPAIAHKASTVREWNCVAYPVTEERLIEAIRAADAYGRALRKQGAAQPA